MDKEEYFRISQKKGLTSRCPILSFCQRRAHTIYFFSDYKELNYSNNIIKTLIDAGEITSSYLENEIKMTGELPAILKGNNHGRFTNMCPEVNLFDLENAVGYFKKSPCSTGSWDEESNIKFVIEEEKHFSECSEFAKHFYENRILKESNKTLKKGAECYTYLMINLKTNLYKIGISKSPIYREKTLQSEEPKIKTIHKRKFITRSLAKEFENELHLKFDSKRVRGEWFNLDSDGINKIIDLMNN